MQKESVWFAHMLSNLRKSPRFNRIALALLDACVVVIAGLLAFLVRFEFSFNSIPNTYLEEWYAALPVQIIITFIVFFLFHMYSFMWDSISVTDFGRIVLAVTVSAVLCYLHAFIVNTPAPRSVVFMTYIFVLVGACALRYCYRIFTAIFRRHAKTVNSEHNVMLVGGGAAGRSVVREYMNSEKIKDRICCIIDDDLSKQNKYIEGVKVVGGREDIGHYVKKYDVQEIIFAIPTASPEERKEILNICKETGCRLRYIPGMYQLVNGQVTVSQLRDVQIEDLLGRESIKLDLASLNEFLGGKTVLVTGGGGSIGSELCRQIAAHKPGKLIIVDIYENNAYDIQQELKQRWGNKLDMKVIIASVRDKERIYSIFEKERPEIVFHAAAHKHVPLMEDCPAEAVKNNIFGTYHVVRAAEKFGTKKFVMISTDKAVNPTNFMGATKRFCEMILQSRVGSTTEFCCVRFGNVLGSNGSVVPLFKKQIAEGGPVTITDKRIIRYFMTIPEAVQLVLEAGSIAKQSQIFVLDMGEPVKILDLAENLIKLSGLVPYKDIQIEEVGLRPGEKLYEELLMKSENLSETENKKIFIENQQPIDPDQIMANLEKLDKAVTSGLDGQELITMLRSMIPTYHAPEDINGQSAAK